MGKTFKSKTNNSSELIREKLIENTSFNFTEKVEWEDSVVKLVSIKINDKEDWRGFQYKKDNVVVLPYTTNNFGLIQNIGMLEEFNPLRDNKYSWTLVTGTEDDSDETGFDIAKRELMEESGYDVQDSNLWTYLGELTTSKIIDYSHPCYAVNLTNIKKGNTDKKSSMEKLSKFEWKPLSFAIQQNDAFVLSLLMKFYIINFSKTFEIKEK